MVPDTEDGLGAEERLLLSVCRARLLPEQCATIRNLIAGTTMDWSQVVDLAYAHRVLPLLARNLLTYDLVTPASDPRFAFRHERLLQLVLGGNELRNEALLRELAAVLEACERDGLPVVVRKGAVLLRELYQDAGVRHMDDVDLMVEEGELDRLAAILERLGYRRGVPSRDGRVIEPMPRRQAVYRTMHVPNAVFLRPTSDRFVVCFAVDVCLNQFLPGTGYDLPARRLVERSRPFRLHRATARAFIPEELLIDLCVHLYKEATTLRFIASGKDITLSKFLDIREYAGSGAVPWNGFVERCRAYGIEAPVYYALHFTDLLYPDVLPAPVLDALRPDDLGFLDEFGAADRDVHTWREGFIARMFDSSRATQVPTTRALL